MEKQCELQLLRSHVEKAKREIADATASYDSKAVLLALSELQEPLTNLESPLRKWKVSDFVDDCFLTKHEILANHLAHLWIVELVFGLFLSGGHSFGVARCCDPMGKLFFSSAKRAAHRYFLLLFICTAVSRH